MQSACDTLSSSGNSDFKSWWLEFNAGIKSLILGSCQSYIKFVIMLLPFNNATPGQLDVL